MTTTDDGRQRLAILESRLGGTRMADIELASERLMEAANAEAVILFGSQARGDAGKDSDVDLCVVIPQDADPTLFSPLKLWPAVADVGLDFDIDLVTTRPSNLRTSRDDRGSMAYDIARDGVVLKGSVEGFFRR